MIEKETKIIAFAARMARAIEPLEFTDEDRQFYDNNKEEIEVQLLRLINNDRY